MFRNASLLILAVLVLSGASGDCLGINQIVPRIDNAVELLEDYEELLGQESSQWRSLMEQLSGELSSIGRGDLAAQVDSLLQRAISGASTEVRATADFFSRRMQEGLCGVIEGLTNSRICPINPPAFVNVSPPVIEVDRIGNGLSFVEFYGYDFDRRDANGFGIQLWLQMQDGRFFNLTNELLMQSHYKLIVTLGSNGIQIPEGADNLFLYWGESQLSSLPIIQPEAIEPMDMEVNINSLTWIPPHTRGDSDYKGHGPRSTTRVILQADGNRLAVAIYMKAEEWENGQPKSDFTTAEGWSQWQTAYTFGSDIQLLGILSDTETTAEYVDDDHGDDVINFPVGELVREFTFIGDTGGADAGVDTRVTVHFNPIRVRILPI